MSALDSLLVPLNHCHPESLSRTMFYIHFQRKFYLNFFFVLETLIIYLGKFYDNFTHNLFFEILRLNFANNLFFGEKNFTFLRSILLLVFFLVNITFKCPDDLFYVLLSPISSPHTPIIKPHKRRQDEVAPPSQSKQGF